MNETLLVYVTGLIIVFGGLAALHFVTRFNRLKSIERGTGALPSAARYKPMLRLLSAADAQMLSHNKVLARQFRQNRAEIFRTYLKCLSRDYGQLLAGIRNAMVHSASERPELIAALRHNQFLFAVAICRVEYRVWLYRAGIGTVDVSGLVNAMDSLRSQVNIFTPAAAGVR